MTRERFRQNVSLGVLVALGYIALVIGTAPLSPIGGPKGIPWIVVTVVFPSLAVLLFLGPALVAIDQIHKHMASLPSKQEKARADRMNEWDRHEAEIRHMERDLGIEWYFGPETAPPEAEALPAQPPARACGNCGYLGGSAPVV